MTAMTTALDGDKRAALLRAARGEPRTGPVPQGIRVVARPAAPAAAAVVSPPAEKPASAPPTTEPAVAEPPATEVAVAGGSIEQLLASAEACTSPRVQGLASRVRELVAELEGRLATAAQELEAEQQVVLLRVQLAEAEQRLRTLRWGDTSPATPTRSATSTTATKEEMRAARQWALANGVECSTTGRVSARVIEAWRAAVAEGGAR
jgi:hypothetical protein